MPGPLEGVRILDLTWVLSGPFCSMTLCDLGAEVIKLERPPYGDVARTTGPFVNHESIYFFSINRGKKSIMLDLKSEEGKDLFRKLINEVDVLIENFTPGSMDRLGLGYEALSQLNPRLIYAAVSGFGQTGPDRARPALDVVVQGMGGVMSITGEPGGRPVKPGFSLGDITAGLYTAIGVLAALHERETSGLGQMVDVSMLDCQIAVLENAFARYSVTGEAPKPLGTRHPSTTPFQAFPTKDGYIVIALGFGLDNIWAMFCAILGVPELLYDPRFETPSLRTRYHAELEPILNAALMEKTTEEWLVELEPLQIPCGPLQTIPQAAAHPQVIAREMLVEVESASGIKVKIPNSPIKLSRTKSEIRGGPPEPGRDTRSILASLLGMSEAEIDGAFASGAASIPEELPAELTE